MAATDRDVSPRAVRWLAAQTAVVALLAGVVHQLTMSTLFEGGFSYMGADSSGVGAVVGLRSVQGFLLAGAVLFACWPALVLGVRQDEGARQPWFLAAVLVPAATTAAVLVGASGDRWLLVVPVVVGVAVVVVLSLAVSLLAVVYTRSDPDGRLVALALGVAVLAVCAFAVGAAVAAPLADLTETRHGGGIPQAMFAFEPTETADGTRLTITQNRGDRVQAGNLYVEVRPEDGLVAVPGATQTREGPWNGTTSTDDGARVVEPGDTVMVGLTDPDDCVVRVVYRDRGDAATLDKYDCEDTPA